MNKEKIIGLATIAFFIMIIISLFTNNAVQDTANDTLHEIKTADTFKQAAYQPGVNCPLPQQVAMTNGAAGAGMYPYQGQAAMQQVATATATPIAADQVAPELIKYMGVEAIEVAAGKVKITGVMGASWADKSGLKPGDILLSFDTQPIMGLKAFQAQLAKVPPEKDYKFTYLRGARKKKGIIFIGEGEMEGFLPIQQPK
ncbi:MAG: PDZ domain-containing protein [Candidatus Omnitrophica bacterium]|nr:PDZ domain-containing protein [Candidatus Omnitrophota bacterium]